MLAGSKISEGSVEVSRGLGTGLGEVARRSFLDEL